MLTARMLEHILYGSRPSRGGGHMYGHGWKAKGMRWRSEFSQSWTQRDITNAIREVLENHWDGESVGSFPATIKGEIVTVAIRRNKAGAVEIKTAHSGVL
ncbi:hypothetical protein G7Y41_00250 [Schaalia sp. ZJ405]|uniref:hypothetical protein n=1 Tax=Schaalia sp. ZJ405 TaxID=2709403 RepID=UPI0018C9F053|nr:hypothetical protein [Schaalia sp. ZJ405]QPK81358.1 hypothetical protein G7Y41_00250 [Schaalia sp. ZJ405]